MNKPVQHKKPGSEEKKKPSPRQVSGQKKAVPPVRRFRTNAYIVLSLLVFALVLYGNTVYNRYGVDDNLVATNPLVKQGFKALPEIFSTRYYTQEGNVGTTSSDYRPLVKATFAIEHQLWGEKPGRSHLINILLYWALAVLLFFVLKRMLAGYNQMLPYLVTLLFMAHPVHTEVVASLKNRDEMLAFIGGLSALLFMMKYAERKRFTDVVLAALLLFLGYLCKSSVLPFLLLIPLVLIFFDLMPFRKVLPVFLLFLVALIIAQVGPRLFLPPMQRTSSFMENPLYLEKDFWLRLGTGLSSLLFYPRILVWPWPLLYYYGYDMVPVTNPASLRVLGTVIIYGGLLVWALLRFPKRHLLSFAILWFMAGIAMYSNVLVPVAGIIGERFVFNASLGFVLALGWILYRLSGTDPKSITIEPDSRLKLLAMVVVLLIPAGYFTVKRNRAWQNIYSLYRTDLPNLNNSVKANLDYASFLMNSVYQDPNFLQTGAVNQFKYQTIVSHYRRALDMYPDNYLTTNDLGTVYLFMGKNYDSAIYFLNKAIAIDSTLQPAWVNLGMAYRELKQYDKAIAVYEHILQVNPNQVKAVFALANVYNDMGQFDRAVQMNEEMMKKYPDLEMPYVNIGNYHMLKQDTATAVSYWEKAASIRPSFELCVQLNSLFLIKGDQEKAAYYYRLGEQIAKQSRP